MQTNSDLMALAVQKTVLVQDDSDFSSTLALSKVAAQVFVLDTSEKAVALARQSSQKIRAVAFTPESLSKLGVKFDLLVFHDAEWLQANALALNEFFLTSFAPKAQIFCPKPSLLAVDQFAKNSAQLLAPYHKFEEAMSLLRSAQSQLNSTQEVLRINQNSLSWKLTVPLRAGMRVVRSARASMAAATRDLNRRSSTEFNKSFPSKLKSLEQNAQQPAGVWQSSQWAKPVAVDDSNRVVGSATGLAPAATPTDGKHVSFKTTLVNENKAVVARRVTDDQDWSVAIPLKDQPSTVTNLAIEKVAVVAHIFYEELAPDIFNLLANIPCRADVFISTTSEEKRESLAKAFSDYRNGSVEIRVFENRGRDIAPKLVGFADIYDRYEYFLHIHSKRTLHAGDQYAHWRDYLYKHLIGSKEIVLSNLMLLSQPEVGIVYPQHLPAVRPSLNWGWDFERASGLLAKVGVTLSQDMLLEFPSGSMFWGRSAAIRPLLQQHLKFADFEVEAGQYDGTLGHAIERSYLYFAEVAGFKWVKVSADEANSLVPKFSARFDQVSDAVNKVNIRLLESRPEVVTAISNSYVGLTEYKLTVSNVSKPRLNLLIPTINPAQTFGGVATAIKIFKQLGARFGATYDLRILVLDAAIEPHVPHSLFPSYFLETLNPNDQAGINVIQPGHDRLPLKLPIRNNDVFMATAWWTAVHGFRFLDFQKSRFGHAPKMIYLIQDYEPSFYGWSTKWALAESTYRRPNDTIAIINSEELHRSMMAQDYYFASTFVLPFRLNESIAKNLRVVEKEKILLIYGRPGVERNCTEIVIDALRLFQLRMPSEAAQWRVISLGEDYPLSLALNMSNFEIRGKVSLEEYADLLSRASLGISLMVSPHPSYPPLEMASAGVYTVTNSYKGKNLAERSDYILSVDRVDPEFVYQALTEALVKIKATQQPLREIRDLGSVSPAFEFTDDLVCRCVDEALKGGE